jgi:hypothetical protein
MGKADMLYSYSGYFGDILNSILAWLQGAGTATGQWFAQSFSGLGPWLSRWWSGIDWHSLADNPVLTGAQNILASWETRPDVAVSSSLAALATVLALASISQTRVVRKRLEGVKGDFFAAFRPKVIIRDVYAPHCNSGEPIEVRYSVCNVGGSPAKVIESAITVEVMKPAGLALLPQCHGRNPVGEIRLDPGEVHESGFCSQEVTWERHFIQGGTNNAPRLVFAGQIGYEDARGIKRHTAFCRRFDIKRERFYPMEDPELEYAD